MPHFGHRRVPSGAFVRPKLRGCGIATHPPIKNYCLVPTLSRRSVRAAAFEQQKDSKTFRQSHALPQEPWDF
jgi:hypothetical protein